MNKVFECIFGNWEVFDIKARVLLYLSDAIATIVLHLVLLLKFTTSWITEFCLFCLCFSLCLHLCVCICVFVFVYLCICVFVYFNLSDAIAPIVLHLELLLITSWITEVYLYFSLCLHLCICMCILICLTLLFCWFGRDPKSGRYGRCSQVPQPNPTSMKFHLENMGYKP